jgi:hypothetical protein
MIAAFMRHTGESTTHMLWHRDNWGQLKLAMCESWGVEEPFNSLRVWEELRHGHTILLSGIIYCVHTPPVFDDEEDFGPMEMLDGEFKLFAGDVTELFYDQK